MTRETHHRLLTNVMPLLAGVAVLLVGCASRGSPDQVKQGGQSPQPRDVGQMEGPFQSPQMQSFNARLIAASTQSKTTEVQRRLHELEARLQHTVDRLDRLAEDFRKTQDELVRVRLDRALERQAAEQRSTRAVIRLEEEMPASATTPETQAKASVPSNEAKQRLKDLIDQLRGLLERD